MENRREKAGQGTGGVSFCFSFSWYVARMGLVMRQGSVVAIRDAVWNRFFDRIISGALMQMRCNQASWVRLRLSPPRLPLVADKAPEPAEVTRPYKPAQDATRSGKFFRANAVVGGCPAFIMPFHRIWVRKDDAVCGLTRPNRFRPFLPNEPIFKAMDRDPIPRGCPSSAWRNPAGVSPASGRRKDGEEANQGGSR